MIIIILKCFRFTNLVVCKLKHCYNNLDYQTSMYCTRSLMHIVDFCGIKLESGFFTVYFANDARSVNNFKNIMLKFGNIIINKLLKFSVVYLILIKN